MTQIKSYYYVKYSSKMMLISRMSRFIWFINDSTQNCEQVFLLSLKNRVQECFCKIISSLERRYTVYSPTQLFCRNRAKNVHLVSRETTCVCKQFFLIYSKNTWPKIFLLQTVLIFYAIWLILFKMFIWSTETKGTFLILSWWSMVRCTVGLRVYFWS